MSGGSQHNPNGRQQMGPGWSPLQLQMANLLVRAPQAHMASDRGVMWHTPTPPAHPHLYHVPTPSPPDSLQNMKGGNTVFRHTATPPEHYRHTPTPPDKHLMRHTPSPGDVKAPPLLTAELYPHLGSGREKLVRPEDLLAYARGGVDLSLGGSRSASNGASSSPAPTHPASPALSVRDAPTINNLITRVQPRLPHTRVDALLERLAPSPVSPHSVIMHSRAAPTPSPPSSNEDSADSCGAPPGSKRKRKPERTIRVPSAPPPSAPVEIPRTPVVTPVSRVSPPRENLQNPIENGDTTHEKRNGPDPPEKPATPQPPELPHTRRKTRSGSAETIDDIAAMIASTTQEKSSAAHPSPTKQEPYVEADAPVTVDKLKSVLASPEPETEQYAPEIPAEIVKPEIQMETQTEIKSLQPEVTETSPEIEETVPPEAPSVEAVVAPKRRRSTRNSNPDVVQTTNVPVESPSEAKPAEPEASQPSAEPTVASFVEVENQLEKMFAGIEEEPPNDMTVTNEEPHQSSKSKPRRKSAPTKGETKKISRRSNRMSLEEKSKKRTKKTPKKSAAKGKKETRKEVPSKDAYDSGSNASSSRSRGPYIQVRGPHDSPHSVSVINATTGEEDGEASGSRRKGEEFRNGLRRARGLHCSTLGLRYDATTPDATWLCIFCEKGPHAEGLGDLFGPYSVDTDCEEYRALDELTRDKYPTPSIEVWFHEECALWAPGLIAAGARVWGLASAVWGSRGSICEACGRAGAGVTCGTHGCLSRIHVPCVSVGHWTLTHDEFKAHCALHA